MEMGDFQFLILYHNLINFQYKYLIFLLFVDIYVAWQQSLSVLQYYRELGES